MELEDIDLKELIERELAERFNRQGYIRCPFHSEKTPSLSIKFFPDTNKYKFKCFGCGESGDAIDFIMKFKGISYVEAREYLGLTVEKSIQEEQIEKVKSYIEWEQTKFRNGQKLLGVFSFTDKEGNLAYFKAKFRDSNGDKNLAYYHIENDKVINKRGGEELPYNLYCVLQGIKSEKVVIICEGEKDANTLNSLLRKDKYVATSVKGCKNISALEGAMIYVCSDTGKAGEQYKWDVYKNLFALAKEFKFINLPGIKTLGDNKDVTDWLEDGHTKKDLINAFSRSLDLKNKYELQQDAGGIYKMVYSKKEEEYHKVYITNFRLIEASRISFIDDDQEGIKLIVKSNTGVKFEKIGPSTVFDDLRSFKNFLGSIDLAFLGSKAEILTEFKIWINRYFALELEEIHEGIKFTERNGEILFITNGGAIGKDKIDYAIKSNGSNNVNIIDTELINKEELKLILKYLFKFATPEKTISIIGSIINNLAAYQNSFIKQKLHHLLIVGESGCGKSTILENVIAPILNYPKKDIKSIGLITPFALIKSGSDGNYPMLFDEFKPSALDNKKIAKLSEIFRNLYDRATISRGNKSFQSKDFQLQRPLVIVGEESYPNNEKALIERSCIVYLSKRERTEEHTKAMNWIIENDVLLNKLGRSLIDIILDISIDDYTKMRENYSASIKGIKNRPLNTAINICCGMEILNILLKKNGIKETKDFTKHVIANIMAEVLENGKETYSAVEQMLILYNTMIEDGRTLTNEHVVKNRGDGLFIKTSEMINQIKEHVNRVGADIIPLSLRDFKKQAERSGYLIGSSNKVINIDGKSIRFDTYSKELLRGLRVDSIVPPEIMEVTGEEGKVIPF
ncbi:CHC2 zinc finger domain-containing protein [Clostridium sp. CX1]|uniref:CHC2 zinc finger domain-containing protein n=1 Tax=Clostridium sp. CX1 TaxID=2978346 RepID=UPI0021C2266D|nr:CHC2 zinc finger domain-containing protein [Clostridium sp. CX1]MCT8978292.1 CHC2 zinc finger domain-containing protein [Clostridium sp. CX1]